MTVIRYDAPYRVPIEFALQDAGIFYIIAGRGKMKVEASQEQVQNALAGRVSKSGWTTNE